MSIIPCNNCWVADEISLWVDCEETANFVVRNSASFDRFDFIDPEIAYEMSVVGQWTFLLYTLNKIKTKTFGVG